LSPQQISRQLLDGKLNSQQALERRDKLKSAHQPQFLLDLVFVSGLLNPAEEKLGAIAARYERGLDVLVELLLHATSSVRTKLVNTLHQAIFDGVRSGVDISDNMPAGQKDALSQVYLGLQSRSAVAAMLFLSRGMDKGRNDRIFKYLDRCIDRELIIQEAIGAKRLDVLHQRSRWPECLPHLNGKARDAYFGGDLGL